jgi:hypothetical protein
LPYQHRMMEKEGYLLVTASVSCDLESTLESMRRAKVELRGAPGLAVVMDIRRAAYHPTPEEAKELADLLSDKELAGGRRVAFVVEAGVQYGVARMVSMFSGTEGTGAAVFLDYESGVAWAVNGVVPS